MSLYALSLYCFSKVGISRINPDSTSPQKIFDSVPPDEKMSIDNFQGKVQIQWDPQLNATTLGQLPFFVEYLKISGLFAKWGSRNVR